MTYQEFDKNINLGSLKIEIWKLIFLALLKLVEDEREQILTAELLLKLTGRMHFQTKKFNVEWLKIKDEPDENTFMNSKRTLQQIKPKLQISVSLLQLPF
jgi:hypothetical protein